MSDEAVDALQRLGLSKYEAEVFVALRRLGGGTARDVAAVADVPRSQVYGAADDLAERGLTDVQHATPKRYRAVSLEVARERLRADFEHEFERAFDALETIEPREGAEDGRPEELWTVSGADAIASRVVELVRDADEQVLYGVDASLLEADVATTLCESSTERRVTVASADDEVLAAFEDEPVETVVLPAALQPEDWPAGRILITDDDAILLSILDPSGEERAFWSSGTAYAAAEIRLIDGWFRDHVDVA